MRCDGADWAHNSQCGFYALFNADSPDASVHISQGWEQCFRGAYDIVLDYNIMAGCVVDIFYLESLKTTLQATGSPSTWQTFGASLPWPNDGEDHGFAAWEFVARPNGAQACGVSLDNFVVSGPRPW